MPIIPFFPNFPRFVNTGGRRRRRRDYQSQYNNFRSTNSQGLELLGSTCQSQASTPAPMSAGQYLPQQYSQQHQQPQTPQMQYAAGSQYTGSQYSHSQPASPFAPMQQRPMSAPQQGQDAFMLPSLQPSTMPATSAYQLPNQPGLSSSSLYQQVPTSSVYQPSLVTPIVPSSNNYLPYSGSGHGHSHSLSLTSNPSVYDQKSNPRTLPQPMSAGRALSTLGAIPPSGLSFFGMTPAQQAFFQQRKLPPPPPPQPRVYSFENSTQSTIAETLAITKENKEKRAGSPRERSEGPTSHPIVGHA